MIQKIVKTRAVITYLWCALRQSWERVQTQVNQYSSFSWPSIPLQFWSSLVPKLQLPVRTVYRVTSVSSCTNHCMHWTHFWNINWAFKVDKRTFAWFETWRQSFGGVLVEYPFMHIVEMPNSMNITLWKERDVSMKMKINELTETLYQSCCSEDNMILHFQTLFTGKIPFDIPDV